jgi:hypothetical protein
MEFVSLSVHDAVLQGVSVDWSRGICRVMLTPVGAGYIYELWFNELTELIVPRNQPWGRSVSVNCTRQPESGYFEIEMQSGDVLKIRATTWRYTKVVP